MILNQSACVLFHNSLGKLEKNYMYAIICVLCIISDNRRGVFLQSNSQCRHE